MRNREWIFLLCISGAGMAFANFIGFHVAFGESLPGVFILIVISFLAVLLDRLIAIRLPVIAYASIIGLLAACPASPISSYVISSVNKINFTAPLTMVGAYAGMSISNQLKLFMKQGWKMLIVSLLVMTGTYICSMLIAQAVLSLTGTSI